ncbi:cyanophycinase [Adhaeribacter sp. BT258]|uniref:Cyanophycinase n=1 Tax=Adhaeribacter terrigena TaxID=2793070 RepID=A0ABS1C177_9BACT|nr:cyanophycinase [Adhaeribacter terrigena]MBK0403159.1 cyanophycinase [Adhaeribacter terrigena]
MNQLKIKGTLIALGGGGDDALLQLIHSSYCHTDSYVEVITTAAPEPDESGQAYKDAFRELGLCNAHYLRIDEENEADTPENLERIRRADVFFFTGGDQRRIADFLRGTQVLQIMRERYITDEIVIAGTSAGAVALSDRMIYEGYGSYSLEKGRTKTSTALSFIHGVYIDSHFTERGRFGRLAMAVAKWPDYIGVGLGEGTGVIIREGDQIEAFGVGVVTIIDGSKIISTNLNEVEFGAPVAVENLAMHFLVEGYRYCLAERLFQPTHMKAIKEDRT